MPVVGEEYLQDAAKGGALLKIPSHTLSSWGAPRHSLPADEPGSGKSFKSKGEPPATDHTPYPTKHIANLQKLLIETLMILVFCH